MLSLPTLSPILFCPDEQLNHIYISIKVRTQFMNFAEIVEKFNDLEFS